MAIHLRIIQIAPEGGPIERVKAESSEGYKQMTTELTTEEVISIHRQQGLALVDKCALLYGSRRDIRTCRGNKIR